MTPSNVLMPRHVQLGRLYFFTYSTTPRGGQPLAPHFIRDTHTAAAISCYLGSIGYIHGGFFPNYPPHAHDPRSPRPATDFPPPRGFGDIAGHHWGENGDQALCEDDLIVITTRPPLDDTPKDRPHITPSETSLEKWVHKALRERLAYCSRKRVTILGIKHWLGNLEFNSQHPSDIKGLSGVTAVYLVRLTPRTPMDNGSRGPRILCVFGMSGTDTFVWGDWLVRNRPSLLTEDGVVVAEVTTPDDSTRRTPDHDFGRFASKWKFDVHEFNSGILC